MRHIRIISPSGPIDSTYINIACERLRAWGHEVSVGQHAYDVYGRFAGKDEDRIADWQEACEDETVDTILCSRGGYGLQRIVDRLQATDKLVIGFSDITELHLLENRHGKESLHGLMCKHLATLPEESEMISYWRKALAGETLHYEGTGHSLNRHGEAEGVLIGGNLSVLYGLQGTPYGLEPLMKQRPILLLEDIAERHYHIDRMMNNLRLSGVMSQLGGLVVGQFSDCEEDTGMKESIYQTILHAARGYNYPILFDFPAGHVEHNMPLILGKKTQIRVTENRTNLIN